MVEGFPLEQRRWGPGEVGAHGSVSGNIRVTPASGPGTPPLQTERVRVAATGKAACSSAGTSDRDTGRRKHRAR